jgi:hypothetical protein
MEPIFKSSFLTNIATLYPEKLTYVTGISYMKQEQIIFLKNIASVKTTIFNTVEIKTNSGENFKIVVKPKDKETLKIAILEAMQKLQ